MTYTEGWKFWESIMKVMYCSGLYLFWIQVILLWNVHPLARKTSLVFLEKCFHLFEQGHVQFICTKFSEKEFNLWQRQILQLVTTGEIETVSALHHMDIGKIPLFKCFIYFDSCAYVFGCPTCLDCLVLFVWWQIHADETKSTLQFASRALRVTNCARVNEVLL